MERTSLQCVGLNSSVAAVFAGLSTVVPGADRVPAGVQPAAGSAAQQHDRNEAHGRRRGPVLHADRRQRRQHLTRPTSTTHKDLMKTGTLRVENGDGWTRESPGSLELSPLPTSSSTLVGSSCGRHVTALRCRDGTVSTAFPATSCQCPLPSWET